MFFNKLRSVQKTSIIENKRAKQNLISYFQKLQALESETSSKLFELRKKTSSLETKIETIKSRKEFESAFISKIEDVSEMKNNLKNEVKSLLVAEANYEVAIEFRLYLLKRKMFDKLKLLLKGKGRGVRRIVELFQTVVKRQIWDSLRGKENITDELVLQKEILVAQIMEENRVNAEMVTKKEQLRKLLKRKQGRFEEKYKTDSF